MEEVAKASLRQLKETCLRCIAGANQHSSQEVGAMVTVSKLALQHLEREEELSAKVNKAASDTSQDSLCAFLEATILEGLQEAASVEISNHNIDEQTDTLVDDFWSHCFNLVQLSSAILGGHTGTQSAALSKNLSSLYQLSCSRRCLFDAFLSLGKAVLSDRQVLTLLSRLYKHFWSEEAKTLALHATRNDLQNVTVELNSGLEKLVSLMATIHSFLSLHETVASSLVAHRIEGMEEKEGRVKKPSGGSRESQVISQWLCWGSLCPVIDSFTNLAPKILRSVCESAVEFDKDTLQRGAEMGAVPDQLKVKVILECLIFRLLSCQLLKYKLILKLLIFMVTFNLTIIL